MRREEGDSSTGRHRVQNVNLLQGESNVRCRTLGATVRSFGKAVGVKGRNLPTEEIKIAATIEGAATTVRAYLTTTNQTG